MGATIAYTTLVARRTIVRRGMAVRTNRRGNSGGRVERDEQI